MPQEESPVETPNSNERILQDRLGSTAADQFDPVVLLFWSPEDFWRVLATSHDSHAPVDDAVHRLSLIHI